MRIGLPCYFFLPWFPPLKIPKIVSIFDFCSQTLVAKVKVVFMIFTSLILTFLHCLYGQKLQTQGEKLSSAIYFVPWYEKSRAFKKCHLFMNEMSKRKITISPYRIKDIGLPLLVQVITRAQLLSQ
uniref:Uncharacterized protein n=1 Tax=Cacopsylla melanoneura TaxID=428564 RepID=A0A8D9E6U5_9HEMI